MVWFLEGRATKNKTSLKQANVTTAPVIATASEATASASDDDEDVDFLGLGKIHGWEK